MNRTSGVSLMPGGSFARESHGPFQSTERNLMVFEPAATLG